MATFKTLFMMQIKEKFDWSFLKSPKQIAYKVIMAILGFAVITAFVYFVLWFCQYMHIFSPLDYTPLSVMAVLFLILFIFTLATCTVSLSRELYRSRDNQILLTYPVSSNMVFLSKMLVCFINEVKRTFYFLMPVFIAYAILAKLIWVAYIWIPVMLIVMTVFTVVFAGFLSLPINYVAWFFRKHASVRITTVAVLIAALIGVIIYIITLIPSSINFVSSWSRVSEIISNFLNWFTKNFYGCYAFVSFLCGKSYQLSVTFFSEFSYLVLICLLGLIAIFAALDVWISRKAYTKVIQREFEFDKKVVKEKKPNVKRSRFFSTFFYDGKRMLLDSSILTSLISVIVVTPIVVLLLNVVFSAIRTRLIGQHLVVMFNILIILLFAMSSNVWVSSIYSRDGNALTLEKTKPNKTFNILFTRLMLSFVSSLLVVLPSSIIFIYNAGVGVLDGFLIILIELLMVYSHLLWSAEIDFLHPRIELYQTAGTAARNPNETKSMILSFVLSIVTALLVFLFLQVTPKLEYLRVLPFVLIFAGYRVVSFRYKSELFLEEKKL
ncbi:MAG: hypothetical protein LUD29_05330 [Clostridia bacterium]|nr:hypothetical protein [Clostridia bacterium]